MSIACIEAATRHAKKLGIENVRFVPGDPRKKLANLEYNAIIDTQSTLEADDSAGLRYLAIVG